MIWFWYFLSYSFLGFLLEVAYARLTGGTPERKCLLLLPLCPVYGLGACLILHSTRGITSLPLLFLLGALEATVCEYAVAAFYEDILGVSFWDYSDLPWNLHGRICLPFSLAWGLLTLPLVYWVHPALSPLLRAIPGPVSWMALTTVLADGLLSVLLLKRTRDRDCLKWYAF